MFFVAVVLVYSTLQSACLQVVQRNERQFGERFCLRGSPDDGVGWITIPVAVRQDYVFELQSLAFMYGEYAHTIAVCGLNSAVCQFFVPYFDEILQHGSHIVGDVLQSVKESSNIC